MAQRAAYTVALEAGELDCLEAVAGGRPAINRHARYYRRGASAKHAVTGLTLMAIGMDQSPDPPVPATMAAATEELPP